eukprot:NODE_2397_length_943_cov_252.629505.p2 GENE.NODE_2397_length_943_cov_252.629505~~NODE_2397_length_943_cov_252.629505.p2  ORF type:complete len:307 (-),score=75.62 NODE_2397_length_943_cov_252.629505:6-842(-)
MAMAGGPALIVRDVAGHTILSLAALPASVSELHNLIAKLRGTIRALQRLVLGGRVLECGREDFLSEPVPVEIVLVIDETPLWCWDIRGHPCASTLAGEGATVHFADGRYDYVNVITCEPVRGGVHFFEFVMHQVGDEQWCGVAADVGRAGAYDASDQGWFYYAGRRTWRRGALEMDRERNRVQRFEHVVSGDVIGLLLDADRGRLAFTLNGRVQGACAVPRVPLYLSTTLDVEGDCVELRKPALRDAPAGALERLEGQLHMSAWLLPAAAADPVAAGS